MRPRRRLLLVSLLATVLLGLQLLQSSPLHHHTQHSVDCALCHLQFNDVALDTQPTVKIPYGPRTMTAVAQSQPLPHATPSPYRSRAPPARLS